MATIHTRIESKRGCGYRKPGGKYLVSGESAAPCGKLPIPLEVCPCCNQGIKFSRSFTWIQMKLIEDASCWMGGMPAHVVLFGNHGVFQVKTKLG